MDSIRLVLGSLHQKEKSAVQDQLKSANTRGLRVNGTNGRGIRF